MRIDFVFVFHHKSRDFSKNGNVFVAGFKKDSHFCRLK